MKKANAAAENHSMSDNYFTMLNLPQEFDIDQNKLYKNYIKLQQILHPDKQVNKTRFEKILTLEYTAKVNQAYQTLKNDKKRAEYLLYLEGIIINQEEGNNIHPDPAMLLEILEISEDPKDYDISVMKHECWRVFKQYYAEKDLKSAAQGIIKLQYLNKIS